MRAGFVGRSHGALGLVMLSCGLALVLATTAMADTIIVPDHYATIQGAVDAANPGDTVFVRAGTYHENLTVGKTLTLKGEGSESTFVDGGGTGDVISVGNTANVRIDGLTALNGGSNGIYFNSVTYSTIVNCDVTSNADCGIRLRSSSHNRILHCHAYQNEVDGIIVADQSRDNRIEHCNTSLNTYHGIVSWADAQSIFIRHCTASYNDGHGIAPRYVSSGCVENCVCVGNVCAGICFDGTSGVTVEGCRLSDNLEGVMLSQSSRNSIFRDNVIEWNDRGVGINNTGGNTYGNHFYHNEFTHNTVQLFDWGDLGADDQTWDDGYPSGGNYWSDYDGADHFSGPNQDQPGSDGIGDTPYSVGPAAEDNYPLMGDICPVEPTTWGAIKAAFR